MFIHRCLLLANLSKLLDPFGVLGKEGNSGIELGLLPQQWKAPARFLYPEQPPGPGHSAGLLKLRPSVRSHPLLH